MAAPLATLGFLLAVLALVGVAVSLLAVRGVRRGTQRVVRDGLDRVRRAEAVTDELRDDVQRLHADLARVAARAEQSRYATRDVERARDRSPQP